MKEREGFVTKFKVPTLLDSKMTFSKINRNEYDKKADILKPKEDPYQAPKDPVFRDCELMFNQKDFIRQIKCPQPYNPHFLSEFNPKPQATYQKERRLQEAEEIQKREDYLR
jgi:hypothetical protein